MVREASLKVDGRNGSWYPVCMVLNSQQIREAVSNGDIRIDPFDEKKQLRGAKYELLVGAEGITSRQAEVQDLRAKKMLVLEPGDFAAVLVHEKLSLGNRYVGRFGLQSKYARTGLIATTGPQIDPGYCGRLTLGLANLMPRPVRLTYKQKLVSVEFHRLEKETDRPYSGEFQGQYGLALGDFQPLLEGQGTVLSELVAKLTSVEQRQEKMSGIVNSMKYLLAVGLPVLALMLTAVAVLVAIRP